MKRSTKIAAAIAVALGVGATALYAQSYGPGWGMGGPGWGMGPGWGPGHMMGYGRGAGFGAGFGCPAGFAGGPGFGYGPGAAEPGAFLEPRFESLKSALKITPAQEGVWKAYVDEAKQQADAMRKWMFTLHGSGAATVPERIELRNEIRKQRQAQFEVMTQKLKDLYAALTPEQKALADQYLGGFGPRAGAGPRYR